jgi:plastocyanin
MSDRTTTFNEITVRRASDGIVFPAILIALGALFLLSNFGVVAPLSVRSVLSLWPLIPVLIGIQKLIGRDRPSLALGLQLGAIALGLALLMVRAYVAPFDTADAVEQGASAAIPGAPEVVLTAMEIQFSLSEIHLPAGEVNLTLRDDGLLKHDLTIPALRVHIAAGPGQSVTTGLHDLPRGAYEGFCSVSGHAEAGMRVTVWVD